MPTHHNIACRVVESTCRLGRTVLVVPLHALCAVMLIHWDHPQRRGTIRDVSLPKPSNLCLLLGSSLIQLLLKRTLWLVGVETWLAAHAGAIQH